MRTMSVSPKDYSPKSLEMHARSVAGAMTICRADARILCNEIRNALVTVACLIDAGDEAEAEDRALASNGLDRTLALLFAIEERARRHPPRLPRSRRRSPGR